MDVIIVGAGSIGFQLAKRLIEENNNVILIEKDQDKANAANEKLDCLVINEEGNNLDTLKRAKLKKADYFISVTESDEINMLTCGMVASERSDIFKIAKVRNLHYFNTRLSGKSFLGIDHIINPEIEAARAIVKSIAHGAVSDIISFQNSDLQMRSYTVPQNHKIADSTTENLKHHLSTDFLLALIQRENSYIIPSGNTIIRPHDKLFLLASDKDFDTIFNALGKTRRRMNKILVVGGGKIGSYIVGYLLDSQKNTPTPFHQFSKFFRQEVLKKVAVIDYDYKACKRMADTYPDALVLNADISDEGALEDEQIHNYDLIITTTDNQELNIITAIYAKRLGVKRAIAKVTNNHYLKIASELDIDVPISQKISVVNSILKSIRRKNVKSIHNISGGDVEVIELSVSDTSRCIGMSLNDIKFPPSSLILSIRRKEENIIPTGNIRIQADDSIIAIAQTRSMRKIETLFTD